MHETERWLTIATEDLLAAKHLARIDLDASAAFQNPIQTRYLCLLILKAL
ncbi:MAG: hypothetical protein UV38_C0003G0137 [candidate division TM6 bacterium GW2011_GWE2_42_60]|nr:MAG: hypothetical protein UV38_C0003G0137 [candidate division TM6 bacterium GW2011_GWE2_42_60]